MAATSPPRPTTPVSEGSAEGTSPSPSLGQQHNNRLNVTISNGETIRLGEAHAFLAYYCKRFNFRSPELRHETHARGRKTTHLLIDDRKIGAGEGRTEAEASSRAHLDCAQYLESCDKALWADWIRTLEEDPVLLRSLRGKWTGGALA
ncbi:hypothetical protein RQP46_009111 [Phenoliferia psychrophenolica]